MNKRRLICLFAAACLLPMSAWADRDGPSWYPEFGLEEGLTFGGGDLMSSRITQQPALTPSNVHLYAGDTLLLDAYYRQAIGQTGLSFKTATGFASSCQVPTCLDLLGNSNGPYQFAPVIGEVAVEYAGEGGRIGIGPTGRFLNSLSSTSSVYAFQQVYLKPAYGWFLEYEYDKLGLRYTHLIYHSYNGYAVNGSSFGLYVHLNYRDEDWYPGGQYFEQGAGIARQTVALAFNPREWSF